MPLISGRSKAVIGKNIGEMIDAGHPRNQAIAAAFHQARRSRAVGGLAKPLTEDDVVDPAAKDAKAHIGPIHAPVAGRTDHLNMHVPSGSYVIPADVVSAFGEGNTEAGFKIYDDFCQDHSQTETAGQITPQEGGQLTPIVAAGGEYVIPPSVVRSIGGGNIDAGHAALDDFVVQARRELIKTLKKLPPPKKD